MHRGISKLKTFGNLKKKNWIKWKSLKKEEQAISPNDFANIYFKTNFIEK